MSEGTAGRGAAVPEGVLPCGRGSEDLLDQVAAGRAGVQDGHQASCVHCRAALAEADRLWAPVRALAGRLETPPPGLVEEVMRSVRALARDVWHVVLPGERGSTRIAARVVGEIAQRAAARVPGVRVALSRHRHGAGSGAGSGAADAVGVAGRHVTVDLAVVVAYGTPIPDAADGVRATVRADLAGLAAVETTEVNVHVDDVAPPAGPPG